MQNGPELLQICGEKYSSGHVLDVLEKPDDVMSILLEPEGVS